MIITPRVYRSMVTTHVVCSVGWLGSVGSFLALSIAAVSNSDTEAVRSSYLAMNLIGEAVIVPASLASLITGLIVALTGPWGLLRHYWVLVKFLLTLSITVALLLHQFIAVEAAAKAVSASAPGTMPDVGRIGSQLVGDAAFALLVLLGITTLSIFKPWGRTSRSQRRDPRDVKPGGDGTDLAPRATERRIPQGLKLFLLVLALLLGAFIVMHLTGGGMHHHLL